jgi:hypothetical protein
MPPSLRERSAIIHRRDDGIVRVVLNGTVRVIYDPRRNMTIYHNLDGHTRVVTESEGRWIVAERGSRYGQYGYVEQPFLFRGLSLARRTYVAGGASYDRFYVRRPYDGLGRLAVYAPVQHYPARFYQWAACGVPLASLSEYLIAESLNEWAARGAGPSAQEPPKQIKEAVAAEIQQSILQEGSAAVSSGDFSDPMDVVMLLKDGRPHLFLAGRHIDLQDAGGRECQVSEGDVLQVEGAPVGAAVRASVVWSKEGAECPAGVAVQVKVADLQEMHNYMRETIDIGMMRLEARQGHDGLPRPPGDSTGSPSQAAFVLDAPASDSNAVRQIMWTFREAALAEQEVEAAEAD